jgi:hypothetical protein
MPADGGVVPAAAEAASTPGSHATMLVRFGCAFVFTVVGLALLTWQRKRLPTVVGTRSRRIFVEVLLLGAFEFGVAVLIGAVDLKSALGGKIASGDNGILWALPFVGSAVVLLQAFSVLRSDTSESDLAAIRSGQEVLKTQLTDARKQRDFFYVVSRAFLKVVSRKRERLKDAKSSAEIVSALRPVVQRTALIVACWEIFDKMVNHDATQHYRVRVAYFRVTGPRLEPTYSWNGTNGDCVSLNGRAPVVMESFTFEAVKGCVARAAANSGRTYWIPVAEAADKDPSDPFFFFEEGERDTLKSMVAIPIRLEGDIAKYDVITIDTDREGFFNAQDRGDDVMHIVENLAHRLQMEKQVERFLQERADA